MTATSKNWTDVLDAAIATGKPVTQDLLTAIRDDLVFLKEWLGASYAGGAVQNHSHDGVDSAAIKIGSNSLRNGSFESDLTGWTLVDYTGGSHAIDTAHAVDGIKCLAISSTSAANGGAAATTNEFEEVSGGRSYCIRGKVSASVANVSSYVEVDWFDSAKNPISASPIYSTASTPTSWTEFLTYVQAPSTARYKKLKVIGGQPGVGSAFGTVYFDGMVAIGAGDGGGVKQTFTSSGTWTKPQGLCGDELVFIEGWGGGGGCFGGGGGGGAHYSFLVCSLSALPASASVVIGAGGPAGTPGGTTTFNSTTLIAYGGNRPFTAGYGAGGGGGAMAGTTVTGEPGNNGWFANGASAGGRGYGDAGGGGGSGAGGAAYLGGGGGGGSNTNAGGSSVYGGGGGGNVGGASTYGGAGGGQGQNGFAPGGGGGDNSSSGGRGELRITIFRVA